MKGKTVAIVISAIFLIIAFFIQQTGILASIEPKPVTINNFNVAYVPFVGNIKDAWKNHQNILNEINELYPGVTLGPSFGLYYEPPSPTCHFIIGYILPKDVKGKNGTTVKYGNINSCPGIQIVFPYHMPLYLIGAQLKVYPVMNLTLAGQNQVTGLLEFYDSPKGKVTFIQGYGTNTGLISNYPGK